MSHSSAADVREQRLQALRDEAEHTGAVASRGIRPANSPLPAASAGSGYYQQPLLKETEWTPLIPLYFFVGGATGALGVIGSLADVAGTNEELARQARFMALAGPGISSVLLVADLGRPSRFLNMLRVFKPQSAMSVGSWVLTGFGASAAASSLADLLESQEHASGLPSLLRTAGRVGCVLFGMPFHNYTGVLIAASAIPAWNNRIRPLPREFGMSGLQSAVSLLELSGDTESRALNVLGLFSAAFESWGRICRPLHHRRHVRTVSGGAGHRRARDRQLLRHRPLPLHHGGRIGDGLFGGNALLVAQDQRKDVSGVHRQAFRAHRLSGLNLTFFPQFILGYMGMNRRYGSYAPEFQFLNVLSTAGASILGVGYVVPLIYVIWSWKYGRPAPENPWRTTGLEWKTASPPITHNFEETPAVTWKTYDFEAQREELHLG